MASVRAGNGLPTSASRKSLGNITGSGSLVESSWVPAWFRQWVRQGQNTGGANGFFGEPATPKLLSYTPKKMWTFWGGLFDRDLTAFYGNLPQHFAWSFLFPGILVTLFLVIDFVDNGGPINDGKPGYARRASITLERMAKTSSGDFRGLVSYVLGGYVVRAFSMWYARRKNYAAFCGTTRNLILQLATAMPVEPTTSLSQAEVDMLRSTVGRWAILAHEVGTLKARGEMDSDESKEYLLQVGLTMPGEWETMVKGDRHSTILWWVLLAVKRAHYAGHTTDVELEKCAEAVSLMRAQANDLMSSLDRDIPYPYASLVGALVRINVLLMSLWKSTELYLMFCGMTGIGSQNWGTAHSLNPQCQIPNPQAPNNTGLIWLVAVIFHLASLFFWNLSYQAMYDLGKILHNPFGNRRIDVAHEAIHAGLRRLAEGLLAGGEAHVPPTMPFAAPQSLPMAKWRDLAA